MDQTQPTKEIVTVAEMARMCHLSRSRFYMLVKEGVMPSPSRNETTKRPYYSREQQEQCLLVRKTNCGINGKPILFYSSNLNRQPSTPARATRSNSTTRRNSASPATQVDPLMDELIHGLEQLGITDATEAKIRQVLANVYPDGHQNVGLSTLLMTVFRNLKNNGDEHG